MLPPIIIIGMHRSGTSMVSRLLEELGLFLGKKKDKHHEALFFRNLNEWLVRQSGGAWDNPEPIRHLLDNTEVRALTVDYIRYLMKTPHVVSYLGWRQYLRFRSPANLDTPWGWKDPHNTYTLPLWLDLFPGAKVIHIFRHGVDVAYSLQVRQQKGLSHAKPLHERRKQLRLYWLRQKRVGFADTLRCASLEGGLSLWEAYLKEARAHVRRLESRAMEIVYEDFLAESQRGLASLAHFCGLPVTETAIVSAAGEVKTDRAYAFRDNPELRGFAGRVSKRLARWGFDAG